MNTARIAKHGAIFVACLAQAGLVVWSTVSATFYFTEWRDCVRPAAAHEYIPPSFHHDPPELTRRPL